MLFKQPSSRTPDDEDDNAPIWSPAIKAALEDWYTAKHEHDDDGLKNAARDIVNATAAYHRAGGVPLFAHRALPPQFVDAELRHLNALPAEHAVRVIDSLVDKFDGSAKPLVTQQIASFLSSPQAPSPTDSTAPFLVAPNPSPVTEAIGRPAMQGATSLPPSINSVLDEPSRDYRANASLPANNQRKDAPPLKSGSGQNPASQNPQVDRAKVEACRTHNMALAGFDRQKRQAEEVLRSGRPRAEALRKDIEHSKRIIEKLRTNIPLSYFYDRPGMQNKIEELERRKAQAEQELQRLEEELRTAEANWKEANEGAYYARTMMTQLGCDQNPR